MLFEMAEFSEHASRIPKRSTTATRSYVAQYSRRLHRGALGELLDGRTVEGRYVRELELVKGWPMIIWAHFTCAVFIMSLFFQYFKQSFMTMKERIIDLSRW